MVCHVLVCRKLGDILLRFNRIGSAQSRKYCDNIATSRDWHNGIPCNSFGILVYYTANQWSSSHPKNNSPIRACPDVGPVFRGVKTARLILQFVILRCRSFLPVALLNESLEYILLYNILYRFWCTIACGREIGSSCNARCWCSVPMAKLLVSLRCLRAHSTASEIVFTLPFHPLSSPCLAPLVFVRVFV